MEKENKIFHFKPCYYFNPRSFRKLCWLKLELIKKIIVSTTVHIK